MPGNDGKQTPKTKANEKSTRSTRRGQTEDPKNEVLSTTTGKPEDSDIDPEHKDEPEDTVTDQNNVLRSKLTGIMKETLMESLADFKSLLAKEMATIAKTNDDNMAKFKKDLNTKYRAFESKVTQEQKTVAEKIPKMEQAIAALNDAFSEETVEKLNALDGAISRIEKLEAKHEEQIDVTKEIEKSMEYHVEDVKSNKMDIDRLEEQIRKQQIMIDSLLRDNRKTKAKLCNLQELVNTIDNRQQKYNLVIEGLAEEKTRN